MRFAAPGVALLAAVLAGCTDSRVAGTLLYLTPYGLEDFDCTELNKRLNGAEARLKRLQGLMDKAGASAAGPAINAVVYGPDHSRAAWEVRLYQDEMARKDCVHTALPVPIDPGPAVSQPSLVQPLPGQPPLGQPLPGQTLPGQPTR